MMWLKNKEKWDDLELIEQIEELRKHYCTGPCGQSSSTLNTREATNQALNRVKRALNKLKKLQKYVDKWKPYNDAMPFCPE